MSARKKRIKNHVLIGVIQGLVDDAGTITLTRPTERLQLAPGTMVKAVSGHPNTGLTSVLKAALTEIGEESVSFQAMPQAAPEAAYAEKATTFQTRPDAGRPVEIGDPVYLETNISTRPQDALEFALSHPERYPSWESLLGPTRTEAGDLEAIPLTNEIQLIRETLRMKHSVSDYGPACTWGHSRIFSIRREGNPIATMEICLVQQDSQPDGQTWVVAQVREKFNRRARKELQQAGEEIALHYNQAHRSLHPTQDGNRGGT